jgi:hypothetical protein
MFFHWSVRTYKCMCSANFVVTYPLVGVHTFTNKCSEKISGEIKNRIQNYSFAAEHDTTLVHGRGQSEERILKYDRSRLIGLFSMPKMHIIFVSRMLSVLLPCTRMDETLHNVLCCDCLLS